MNQPEVGDGERARQAEVHGAISFCDDFRNIPPNRHVLKMCRAEACEEMGCDKLIQHVKNRLDIQLGQTTADGKFTVEQIFCLGRCSTSPAVMLDGKPYGRVTPQVMDSLLDDALSPG